jgi:V8-like Glu-specific endopeptidase
MKMGTRGLLLAVYCLLGALPAANAGSKAIYFNDDRKDYFQADPARRAIADAVVSLWDISKLSRTKEGSFLLSTRPFGDKVFDRAAGRLCASEPFQDQPMGAQCSGTLVGPDLVLTAGHCVNTQAGCDEMKVVFDFNVKKRGGQAPTLVPASSVYSCKSIVTSRWESAKYGKLTSAEAEEKGENLDLDYALIRLDRSVPGRKPIAINRGGGLAAGDRLFTIGHPVGLPAKIADDAEVTSLDENAVYFEANLDTYGGNSGSGVFNERTGLLEGVLARGRKDFVKTKEGCYASNVVPQRPEDGGESVTKISMAAGFIPGAPGQAAAAQEAAAVDSSGIKPDLPLGRTWDDLARQQ